MHDILSRTPQPRKPAMLIAFSGVQILLATTVLLRPHAPSAPLWTSPSTAVAIRLDARVTRRSGNEVPWQLSWSPLCAAVFVAPGCTIRATDFFNAFPGYSRCAGLPEERRFTRATLRRGYTVLTVSSRAECWSLDTTGDGSKLAVVESIIGWWVKEEHPQLTGLPLVGIGESSGGYFLSALTARVRFSSVGIMITEGVFSAMEEVSVGYSPALFVHMPKDAERAQEVAASIGKLKAKHVDVQEIQCDGFVSDPKFVT